MLHALHTAAAAAAVAAGEGSDAGSGTRLPPLVLALATASALLATVLSVGTIWLQLKNYRKITLQRIVVRILIMVPIYSLSSLLSLYSLDAAFFVDAIRDVYEAFVIYCFFTLLVEYLGGERSLIILLHGREPVPHPWPISLFMPPLDVSDPYSFLALKRGILQYVQVKPVLAAITVVLKATGTYKDGSLAKDSGYTYVSIAYNVSVSLSLYCLAMFWVATHDDLQPFRPMPKFLCVKGIIFFSFWQGFAVSILVAAGLVTSDRYPTELLSLAIQDTLISFEMPLFALLHMYAFSYTDYIDPLHVFSARLPVKYALRDSFGFRDVLQDSVLTLRGTGFSYRTFEPAAGALHQGPARERRVRAGLRYTDGGRTKYWLPLPGAAEDAHGLRGKAGAANRPLHTVQRVLRDKFRGEQGYAPLDSGVSSRNAHTTAADHEPSASSPLLGESHQHGGSHHKDAAAPRDSLWYAVGDARAYGTLDGPTAREYDSDDSLSDVGSLESAASSLGFGALSELDRSDSESGEEADEDEDGEERARGAARRADMQVVEKLYDDARTLEFGDYNFPVIDDRRAREDARRRALDEEYMGFAPGYGWRKDDKKGKGKKGKERAGAKRQEEAKRAKSPELPPDAVDIIVEDHAAEEAEMIKERRRGEPGVKRKRIFKQIYIPPPPAASSTANDDAEAQVSAAVENLPEDVRVVREPEPTEGDATAEDTVEPAGDTRIEVREEEPRAERAEEPPPHARPPPPQQVHSPHDYHDDEHTSAWQ